MENMARLSSVYNFDLLVKDIIEHHTNSLKAHLHKKLLQTKNNQHAILCLAIFNCNLEAFKVLLEYGVNPNIISTRKDSKPIIQECKDIRFLRIALEYGLDPNTNDCGAIFLVNLIKYPSPEINLYDAIVLLVEYGLNVSKYDFILQVVRYNAEGVVRIIDLLIDCGAKLNHPESYITPLHVACVYRRPDIIECLLKAGVDPNTPNCRGDTPLHYIPKIGYDLKNEIDMKCLNLLLVYGTDPYIEIDDNPPPIHFMSPDMIEKIKDFK